MNDDRMEVETAVPISLGQQLRQARETKGWSHHDVAQQLKLMPKVIAALEHDDFASIGPKTFAKGYIRSYANLLHLDANSLLVEFNQQHVDAEACELNRPMLRQPVARRSLASARSLRWITYLIILVLVGLVVAWWHTQRSGFEASTASMESTVASLTSPGPDINPEPELQPVTAASFYETSLSQSLTAPPVAEPSLPFLVDEVSGDVVRAPVADLPWLQTLFAPSFAVLFPVTGAVSAISFADGQQLSLIHI